jgi:hypothetical protein
VVHSKPFLWAALLLVVLSLACASPAANSTRLISVDVSFDIPPGTDAALERGDPAPFQFPDVIEVHAGQSVVITNHDYAMHYFFDIPVAPGETIRKPFPRTGEFVYQGGLSCSISRSNAIKVHVQ